jgi:hypothetical protein
MSLALHLCNKTSASTVIQDLQSSTEGFFFSKNNIIPHHPDPPAENNENIQRKLNLKHRLPSLKDLLN